MADYKDKIRKLLALAQSPEEAEAKAALLRARELMAQHKLTEADLEEAKKQAVRDVKTDITEGKLVEAFRKADTVLRAMKRFAGEEG